MKFVVAIASFCIAAPLASAALAADCADPSGIAIAPDFRSASITPTFVVAGGDSQSCDVSVAVPIPVGMYGVYKVDSRLFNALEAGETSTYSVTSNGDTQTVQYVGEINEDGMLTQYFGTGLGLVPNFEGTFGLGVTGLDPFANYTEIDSIDILAFYTSLASVQASIDELAAEGATFVTHLNTTSDLLAGGNQPLEAPDSVSLLGAVGSHTVGATVHYNLGGGFSLDGGAALFSQEGVSGSLFGGSVRYLEPGVNTFRPFGEIGFNAAPGLDMQFSRSYDDGSPDGAVVNVTTGGSLAGAYIKGGFLVAPDLSNQIAFSGTLMHNWLSVDGYDETFGEDNLFNASVAGGSGGFDTIKASVAWTSALTADLDMTLSASLGKTVSQDGVVADVAFVGPITGTAEDDVFVQYGARLGWKLSPTMTADVFVNGSTGSVSGTHAQVGGGLRIAF